MDKKIHLPARPIQRRKSNERPVIRISPEAYDTLVEITNETCLPITRVASMIILQSVDLIVYDREDEENED